MPRMKLTRVKPGLYRDEATGIEIERQPGVLGGWKATAPARLAGHRIWITTAWTLSEARAAAERYPR